ncbi:MAG: 16S rRNA (cytidine(1402)-2'-O)-methyltransferase [Dehalococcoidia bacterium]|nr:16S rRNA (cytidine(1402)-2'-O)-methyltransferase [Dehalococcoidia bacterium]MDW8119848.1 16S rRNA (cytidine(1402)-2'-O)-methyltransferase [Chloroflexota bacterium]
MGTLYVVATPIGNLEDITLRALRLLREVALIAAEDTRTTRGLLAHYGITTPLVSFHRHNQAQRLPLLLERLRQSDVALVSEAGTPGVSDPGQALVTAAVQKGFPVVVVPGPSAVTAALAVSGLPADSFLFLGFLPRAPTERRSLLGRCASLPFTLVWFEAPHRLRASLQDALEILGDRPCAIGRELTKLHEEVFRGSLAQALEHFIQPRGEFTVVVRGAPSSPEACWTEAQVAQALREASAQGLRPSHAVARVARMAGWPRAQVYAVWRALGGIGPKKTVSPGSDNA